MRKHFCVKSICCSLASRTLSDLFNFVSYCSPPGARLVSWPVRHYHIAPLIFPLTPLQHTQSFWYSQILAVTEYATFCSLLYGELVFRLECLLGSLMVPSGRHVLWDIFPDQPPFLPPEDGLDLGGETGQGSFSFWCPLTVLKQFAGKEYVLNWKWKKSGFKKYLLEERRKEKESEGRRHGGRKRESHAFAYF